MLTAAIILFVLLSPGLLPNWTDAVVNIGRFRFGASHHVIRNSHSPYLERWILWYGLGTLRLHKFHRGDDDRAPHNHPFWFITFPLGRGYSEKVYDVGINSIKINKVAPYRFHFRSANHTHVVLDQPNGKKFWTFVITGMHRQSWGFFPWSKITSSRSFVPWREWE